MPRSKKHGWRQGLGYRDGDIDRADKVEPAHITPVSLLKSAVPCNLMQFVQHTVSYSIQQYPKCFLARSRMYRGENSSQSTSYSYDQHQLQQGLDWGRKFEFSFFKTGVLLALRHRPETPEQLVPSLVVSRQLELTLASGIIWNHLESGWI